jgi:hypothetical protein
MSGSKFYFLKLFSSDFFAKPLTQHPQSVAKSTSAFALGIVNRGAIDNPLKE